MNVKLKIKQKRINITNIFLNFIDFLIVFDCEISLQIKKKDKIIIELMYDAALKESRIDKKLTKK